jgi:hypothetical protein
LIALNELAGELKKISKQSGTKAAEIVGLHRNLLARFDAVKDLRNEAREIIEHDTRAYELIFSHDVGPQYHNKVEIIQYEKDAASTKGDWLKWYEEDAAETKHALGADDDDDEEDEEAI